MTIAPPKYVTTATPCPAGYCPAGYCPECWAANRVIPLRAGAAECWACVGIRSIRAPVFEIEAPPVQAALDFDVP